MHIFSQYILNKNNFMQPVLCILKNSQGIEMAFQKTTFLINIIVATLQIKLSKAFRVVLTYLKICRKCLDSSFHMNYVDKTLLPFKGGIDIIYHFGLFGYCSETNTY